MRSDLIAWFVSDVIAIRADTLVSQWEALNSSATSIYNKLPSSTQASFFQLVLHPVRAGLIVTKMWIFAGINNMRSVQARLSANNYADDVESLFDMDFDLEHEYHTILNGETITNRFR